MCRDQRVSSLIYRHRTSDISIAREKTPRSAFSDEPDLDEVRHISAGVYFANQTLG